MFVNVDLGVKFFMYFDGNIGYYINVGYMYELFIKVRIIKFWRYGDFIYKNVRK